MRDDPGGAAGFSRRWLLALIPVVGGVAAAALAIGGVLVPPCASGGATIGCAAATVVPRPGVSVVTGSGRLTGAVRTRYGTVLHEFEIRDVHVLDGPDRASTVRAWLATVPSPGPGLAAAQVPGLWAPDGRLLAHLGKDPGAVTESSTVQVRPIVHGDVVFSAADCGSAPAGLRTVRFDGRLAEVPNSGSYAVARCNGGFRASPLREVQRLLH